MDAFTLYVGQGALAGVRNGNEGVIVDAHMPECDDVTSGEIEQSLRDYLVQVKTRGLVITGLDRDHAHPGGVEFILEKFQPDWVMYPKCYKQSDSADQVFDVIDRVERKRARSGRPLTRHSIRVDRLESRFLQGLATNFNFEVFSPHIEDMDTSNNCSIVMKVQGLGSTGFRYLVTGDTETERWERIAAIFGDKLRSDVMAAAHHGSVTGAHAQTLLHVSPHTILVSAGVDNQYGHPDAAAMRAYRRVATEVYATNEEGGTCLFTKRAADGFKTYRVRHSQSQTNAA